MEASSPREEVVRALVRFLEAATVADFPVRLEMLGSVGRLLDMIGHRRLSLRATMHFGPHIKHADSAIESGLKVV